jgi:hypothetical protein
MIAPDEFGGKSLARALHEPCMSLAPVPQPTPGLSRDAEVTVKIAWGAAFSTSGITDSLGQS